MAAHPTMTPASALEPSGIERPIARHMPTVMVGAVAILVIAWWMAAQPPPGPGWGNPYGPQNPNAPPQQYMPPQPRPGETPPSSGCSACSGDCLSGIDCADCGNCIDCADCLSGIDCSGCTVAGTKAETLPSPRRACSTNPWKRLAGSSGLLLPLFVLIGWRRRLRR